MKKLLISQNEIIEIKKQYNNKIKIVTENFSGLVNFKSGTIKPYILNEEVRCLCSDGTKSIDCCKTNLTLDSHVSDSIRIVNYALSNGLELKDRASSPKHQTSWSDVVSASQLQKIKDLLPEFSTYVPEIVSGLSPGFSFNEELIDLASDISDLSGVKLKITGGNDKFHKGLSYLSDHKAGDAIDVVPTGGMNDATDLKIEKAVISLISNGKYGKRIGFINERLRPSGAASGAHFHISLTNNTKYSWFGFIDINGDPITSKSKNLTWADGGKYPKLNKTYPSAIKKPEKYKSSDSGDIYIDSGQVSDKTKVNNIYKKEFKLDGN